MMMHKAWNIRDQTEETLRAKTESLYKEIDKNFKLLKKITKIEDAKEMVDYIWAMKAMANEIELELLRRKYNHGTTS